MCSIDQLEVLLARDQSERLITSEDDAEIPPRNILLESTYSVESGISEQFQTVILNHLIQFAKFKVIELTMFHAYKILEL